jgi:biopolymer transport protein ExbB/TolQ
LSGENLFNRIAETLILTITHTINQYSGILQITIYFLIFITFGFGLLKIFQALKSLVHCSFNKILYHGELYDSRPNPKTPLSVIAAGIFAKAKMHYLDQSEKAHADTAIPPDAFVRDAAFQFSQRYFESKFLDPMTMLASLMPPLGFIGTIMGMVIHFLSSSGDLKSGITVVGIATALYTTFIGLIMFAFMESIKRCFFTLAQKRIDEGLEAVSDMETPLGTGMSNESKAK